LDTLKPSSASKRKQKNIPNTGVDSLPSDTSGTVDNVGSL
jgi:hypothetical protein